MNRPDKRFALMLADADGIGAVKYKNLLEKFSDYDGLLENGQPEILHECGLSDKQINYVRYFNNWPKIDSILEQARQLDVNIICMGESNYPEQLLNIYSPPMVLYVKGDPYLLNRPSVAIVGSRMPTSYGRSMASKLAADLAAHGLVVVSGLAMGIDAEAHQAALDIGGFTGAVFGNGIDIIYPSDHRDLASRISQSGYLVSEFSFGTTPERYNFPRRNRIISGLALAVVVVEAAARSGALVTANIAAEQGKDVYAVPGPADSPKSDGTINLIKQGAYVATCADDILQNLGWDTNKKAAENTGKEITPKINLEPEEQKICDIIAAGPLHFDDVVRNLGLPSAKLSAIILKLELAGLIVRRPGNYLARA